MRVALAAVLSFTFACAAHRAPQPDTSQRTASLAVASDAVPAAGCKCKADANDTCTCAFTGSSCGDGAKYCHEVACKGKGCKDHCKKKICPTMNTQAAPGQCAGPTRNCSERHCLGATAECAN